MGEARVKVTSASPPTSIHLHHNQLFKTLMMENELRVQSTTAEKLIEELRRSWMKDLQQLREDLKPKAVEEYLTRNEVAQMLKVDLSTVHLWTKDGKLIRHGIGKRVYYKRSQIEQALVEIQTPKHI